MIEADPEAYWRKKCGSGSAGLTPFGPGGPWRIISGASADPAAIHGSVRIIAPAATIDMPS